MPREGANQLILEEKSYAGGTPSKYYTSRTQSPRLQRIPCVKLGCILTYSVFVNKENSSSNICMVILSCIWINE